MAHHTTNDHNLHSDVVGLIVNIAVSELMRHHSNSTSQAFRQLVSGGSSIVAKNFWNNHGREIEDRAVEVIRNGAVRTGNTITVYEQHIHQGAQNLINDIWNAYH